MADIQERFSIQAFLVGLFGVIGFYTLLWIFVFFQSSLTMEKLESRLGSQTLFIEYAEKDPDVVIEEPSVDVQPLKQEDKMEPPQETTLAEDLAELVQPAQNSLSIAPVRNLIQNSSQGPLPIVNKVSGLTPFKAYKKPFLVNRDKPALAIGILDYGLSETLSKNILAFLPSSVSLILSPYSANPDQWKTMAREDGHEFWLQMNIQTESFPKGDPGSHALLGNASYKYNQDRLHWTLSRTTGYAGVASFTDESFKTGGAMFRNLVNEVFNRGQGYLEMNPGHAGNVKDLALTGNYPFAENSMILKNLSENSPALSTVENKIKDMGGLTILIRPTPKNLKDLRSWVSKLERNGIQIIPVSAMAALTQN